MNEHTTAGHSAAESGPARPLLALWTCARAVQQAAATLTTRPGADDDLRLTIAAAHCGEAADELQRARPDIIGTADSGSLTAEVSHLPTEAAVERLLDVVRTGLRAVDLDDGELAATDMLAVATAANWLALAHQQLCGRLP